MRMYVFTDERGEIIGSFRPKVSPEGEAPTFKPAGRSRGHVHEVELPEDLAALADPVQLHLELAKRLPRR